MITSCLTSLQRITDWGLQPGSPHISQLPSGKWPNVLLVSMVSFSYTDNYFTSFCSQSGGNAGYTEYRSCFLPGTGIYWTTFLNFFGVRSFISGQMKTFEDIPPFFKPGGEEVTLWRFIPGKTPRMGSFRPRVTRPYTLTRPYITKLYIYTSHTLQRRLVVALSTSRRYCHI